MYYRISIFLAIALITNFTGLIENQSRASENPSSNFPRPAELQPAIEFWNLVFSEYDEDLVLYFDAFDMEKIYEVRRIPTQNGTRSRERARSDRRSDIKESIRDDLKALGTPNVDYDQLQGRRYRLFQAWGGSRDAAVYKAVEQVS